MGGRRSVPLEVLDFAFVFFGGATGGESTEVAALAGMGVGFAGVETVFTGFKFTNHRSIPPCKGNYIWLPK